MRTIPSVTPMTVPTSRASAAASKFWMRSLISWLISEALSAMFLSLKVLSDQRVRQALKPRPQRTINNHVAGTNHRTANQVLVQLRFEAHFAAKAFAQRNRYCLLLGIIERGCGGNGDVHHILDFSLQSIEVFGKLRQHVHTAVLEQELQEISSLRGSARKHAVLAAEGGKEAGQELELFGIR